MPHVYHQGCLDGLCGMYAVINAVNVIVPDGSTSRQLDKCYERVFWGKAELIRKFPFGPVTWKEVLALAQALRRRLSKKLHLDIEVRQIEIKAQNIDEFVQYLKTDGRKGTVAYVMRASGEDYRHYVALKPMSVRATWIDSSEHYSEEDFDSLYQSPGQYRFGKFRRGSNRRKDFLSRTCIRMEFRSKRYK